MKRHWVYTFILGCGLVGFLAMGCNNIEGSDTEEGGNTGGTGGEGGGGGGGGGGGVLPGDASVLEVLEQAAEQLAKGAAEVSLSADNHFVFRRTTEGNVTVEELLVDGRVVGHQEHSGNTTVWKRDRDMDGFMEWEATIYRSENPNEQRMVILTYSKSTRQPEQRESYTRSGDIIHVRREIPASGGGWALSKEFDTTPNQPSVVNGPSPGIDGTCTAPQASQLKDLMQSAIQEGIKCMESKLPAEAAEISELVAKRGIELKCEDLPPPLVAEINWWDALPTRHLPNKSPVEITIDPSRLFPNSPQKIKLVLYHELLHAIRGVHDLSDIADSSKVNDLDPVYACSSMCFDSNPTQCNCAKCLDTKVCDPRCSDYNSNCNSAYSRCPCPVGSNAGKWFDTEAQCRVACPTGTACFMHSICYPADRSC